MNRQRLLLLLAVWCMVMIGPAALAVAGPHGVDLETTTLGRAFAIWIVGYLLQLGIFMWIMRIVNRQNIAMWFAASLLPWAADWSAPVSLLFLIPCAAVVVAISVLIYVGADRKDRLRSGGVPAVGTVLEVVKPRVFNVVINNVYIRRKLRLRIERQDGTPAYEGTMHGLFMLGEIPNVGDTLTLRVDPDNPQHFTDDLGSTPTAGAASPDTAVPAEPPGFEYAGGGDPLAGDLERLATLHKAGSLNDQEFSAAKAKLLGST